jgi:hypothetical protein
MDFPALIAGCPLITEAASVSLIGRSADCPSNRNSRDATALWDAERRTEKWVFGARRRSRALEADTILQGRTLGRKFGAGRGALPKSGKFPSALVNGRSGLCANRPAFLP